jgi:hypothetical protein
MKNAVVLTVLKVEGLSEHTDCQVFQDDFLVRSLPVVETQIVENLIEFPKRGVLTILVKNSSKTGQICSVSLNCEALPVEGLLWLPLYYNSNEVLPSVPSMLPTTKVLVSINTLSLLTPVPEMNESDSSVFDLDSCLHKEIKEKEMKDCKEFKEFKDEVEGKGLKINYEKCKKALMIVNEKNKELRIKFCELQNRFQLVNEELCNERVKESHESFSKLAIQLEKFKLHCNNLQFINEENNKKIDFFQSSLKTEQQKRLESENQLTLLLEESKEFYINAEKRFESYENIIKSKDEELKLLKSFKLSPSFASFEKSSETASLRQRLQEYSEKLEDSEKSRKNLQTKLENSAHFFSKELEELIKAPTESLLQRLSEISAELQQYRQKCAELENLLDDKYLDIKLGVDNGSRYEKIVGELKEQLKIEREINENLLSQAREKNFKELECKLKGADEKFLEYIRNFCIEDRFARVSDGVFSYNGKKVFIAVKNGALVCRVGASCMTIDKFIKSVLNEKEEGLLHKRSQTSILNEKILKEDLTRKPSDKKLKEPKTSLNLKENLEDLKYSKVLPKKSFTKSLTPSRDSLLKRVFK